MHEIKQRDYSCGGRGQIGKKKYFNALKGSPVNIFCVWGERERERERGSGEDHHIKGEEN